MIYPINFEQKIGFDIIREKLKEKCLSSLGTAYVDNIRFKDDYRQIKLLLSRVEEFKRILELEAEFPSQDYLDLTGELNHLKIDGTIIDVETLFNLKISLRTIQDIIGYIGKLSSDQYPTIVKLAGPVLVPTEISDRIEKILDPKGGIRDNASDNLRRIRKDLIKKQQEIEGKIRRSLSAAKKDGHTPLDVEPTIRNGRLVIPVYAANKRKVKGFIHDESATGQTVYIEPTEVFDTNNEIRDLENAEKREIIKILTDFSVFLRPCIPDLVDAYHFIGHIDFIRAKALFGITLEAVLPQVSNKQTISWRNAKHPLLYLSHKQQKKKVVPLNIHLDQQLRILIISGPNAGGKSVCLMTVGLLQYMLQCGLLVPMNIDSEMGIFESIFVDIGDEQSLENDLSTYSSHLLNIKSFIEHIDKQSIFLIDEFGTGTEPQLGGAVAEAVLEELNSKQCFGIVTTHYANLKLMADQHQGITNGAMLFDNTKLKPLYELSIGKPGSSFAFEIARQIGFPEFVLEKATEKTGTTQLDFDKQLQQLEIEKNEIRRKKTELNVADDFLAEMIEKYEKLKADIEHSRERILKDARDKAQDIISGSNKLIENTIREIREIQAQKDKTKKLRRKIQQHKEEISGKEIKEKASAGKGKSYPGIKGRIDGDIKKGDHVKLGDQDIIGEVVEIDKDDAIVSFGTFKVRTSPEQLHKVEKAAHQSVNGKRSRSVTNLDVNDKISNFKLSIDLRGKRVEEALAMLQNYIDNAIMFNIKEVSVIHGKGDGILRDVVREYLNAVGEIKSFKDAHPDRGGHGVTLIIFR